MKLTKIKNEIQNALTQGFVDKDIIGNEEMVPRFILNAKGDTMRDHIDHELIHCSSFIFVIAFITEGALTPLKVKLADLARRGIKGRILTSDYLEFNSPKMFYELKKLKNVEVRIADIHTFHAKGYIFNHNDVYQTAIIGSSNLTEAAVATNYEWNLRVTSYQDGEITRKIIEEIENQWKKSHSLTEKWIEEYKIKYEKSQQRYLKAKIEEEIPEYETSKEINPNLMQQEALTNIENIRSNGAQRALVISATGTGKTYLGAFDVKKFSPDKFLYIVHREQILDKTISSFKKILSNEPAEAFGKVSGNSKDFEGKYLFATIQTLSRDNWLERFDKDEFDYILVDETHRAGAESYKKVLNYFTPQFMLGMTATPDRMDNFNLYELFDYNIAYEIRLQKALDENMLCPFHYIGITDYEVDGQITDDTSQLNWLVSEDRVDYVIKQTEYYSYSGEALQGLIFCSRTEEAKRLAETLSLKRHPSKALTGETPQWEREKIIKELEQRKIEYIITVDVFNEGIDIPCVNQVVMLRNTQSSIVFIQQLGRGLRKSENKKYVTVIDFIGNYKNNYLIPIALVGDKSRDKNSARDDLELNEIAGISTVNFSDIAKEKIYQSINNTSLDSMKILHDDYEDLKARLGRVPFLLDFQSFGTVNSSVFIKKYRNYYQFLLKMKEEFHLTHAEEEILTFISAELTNGKRIVELLLLEEILECDGQLVKGDFIKSVREKGIFYNESVEKSVEQVMSLEFFKKANRKKYGMEQIVKDNKNIYQISEKFKNSFENNPDFKLLVLDAIKAGLENAKEYDITKPFSLYQRYSRKDVCRIIGWTEGDSSTVYGYKVKENVCPIFVTYSKSDAIEDSIKYQDKFINRDIFQWYTRHNVKIDSNEMKKILNKNTTIQLFIKKNDDEGSDFYYFGEVNVVQAEQEEFQVNSDKIEPIVKVQLKLKNTVRQDKYKLFEK